MTRSLNVESLVWGYSPSKPLSSPFTTQFDAGEVTSIIGPNGIGKTCLGMTLVGLLKPLSGAVRYETSDVSQLKPILRAGLVSYLPQVDASELSFTVEEAVATGLYRCWHKLDDATIQAKIDRALAFVGLAEKRRIELHRLSGGEQQRARLARCLVQDTPILVLDEPSTHLDISQSDKLGIYATKLAEEGRIVIAVSHDLEWCRLHTTKCVLLGRDGSVVMGSTDACLTQSEVSRAFDLEA